MSSNNATHDSSTDDNNHTAYCGHTVPFGETHFIGDRHYCTECFLEEDEPWFGIDDYPTVLHTQINTVHEARGTSTSTSQISLIGITEDRTALYHDGIGGHLWTVVPAHSDFHDTDDPVQTPIRDIHADSTLGAPADFGDHDFHTLPNGDHLSVVAVAEEPYSLNEWLIAHADEFRSFTDEYQPRGQ